MKYLTLTLTAIASYQAAALTLATAFQDVTVNKPACFVRQYSQAHLAANPKQTVRQIKIKLRQLKYEGASEPSPVLGIQVRRKGERSVWTNNIPCNASAGRVFCAVECDGGSVEIASRDKAGNLTIKNNGVILHGGCGEQGRRIKLEGERGGDDVFKLKQTYEQNCADVSEEAH